MWSADETLESKISSTSIQVPVKGDIAKPGMIDSGCNIFCTSEEQVKKLGLKVEKLKKKLF